jgi:hypothetical protein
MVTRNDEHRGHLHDARREDLRRTRWENRQRTNRGTSTTNEQHARRTRGTTTNKRRGLPPTNERGGTTNDERTGQRTNDGGSPTTNGTTTNERDHNEQGLGLNAPEPVCSFFLFSIVTKKTNNTILTCSMNVNPAPAPLLRATARRVDRGC